jgi:glycogen phosphorylase
MSKQTRVSHPIYSFLPTEVEGFDSLAELALDMRWSWNHATDKVWRQLDPELWEIRNGRISPAARGPPPCDLPQ